MEYPELYTEYASLLEDKTSLQKRLAMLKDGYISVKTISGKKYTYLQYRINGKLTGEYVREDNLPEVRAELDERAGILGKIRDIDGRLKNIEAAAGILSENLRRKLVMLRRCAAMEMLPPEERLKSLAFGSAMAALEGIPVSEETDKNLSRWANGDLSFQESYINTLRTYHLPGV